MLERLTSSRAWLPIWQGRTDGNKMVILPKGDFSAGDYVHVTITRSTAATLFGTLVSLDERNDALRARKAVAA